MREERIGPHRLLCGDNLEWLPTLEEGSVDLVATDPPYGISFMGKQWDKALPDPQTWVECYRVLKPGGSAVVMSGARLDCLWRMCRDLEAAGFELEQTAFFWCYRTGFPKGSDLSKAADARAGAERDVVGRRPTDPSRPNPSNDKPTRAFAQAEKMRWVDATAPSSPLAVALDGWFTKGKVKPAVEVIIWARKPISEKTELANMERWGVGGVNCGACMVPFESDADFEGTRCTQGGETFAQPGSKRGMTEYTANPAGRFPANLLVTDDALGPENSRYFSVTAWAQEHGYSDDWATAAEAGLLQVAKAGRREKNAGCEGLPQLKDTTATAVAPQRIRLCECGRRCPNRTDVCPRCGGGNWSYADASLDGTGRDHCKIMGNGHPTVKPVTLFCYLTEFLTRPGAVVLDPFLGSGTTLCACAQTGRTGIGVELDPGYFDIALARVRHWQAQAEARLPLTG